MSSIKIATFGGGCFWCIESALNKIKGIHSALSGFSGGFKPNPSYQQVISGMTGHAEVVQVTYDESIISYEKLLELFFQLHDPTTLNRQGNDVGSQYRSIILYHDNTQARLAQEKIKQLNELKIWSSPIVTEVKPYEAFYNADDYHQGFADKNPDQPYCAFLITPKINQFKAKYQEWLK